MTREEAQSCIKTIELLRRLAYNIHGVMDVIDAGNCEKIIEALSREPSEDVRCSEIPNSSDSISRQAAINCVTYDVEHTIECLKALPSAQPERKRGKWVAIDKRYVRCSECGLETTKNELRGIALFGENEPYFCPNCGADMRGMEDG